ncbi:MAG: TraB/GumN family protein [Bacteroidota bacterium]|nr:TraB/GumN family protein [Bacteroidota bacterium]
MFKYLTILILFIVKINSCFAQNIDNEGLLFSISGNGLKETSYVLGTFHLYNHTFITSRPEIVYALASCKQITTEVTINKSDALGLGFKVISLDSNAKKLLSKEDYAICEKIVSQYNADMVNAIKIMKPIVLVPIVMTALIMNMPEFKGKLGDTAMDMYVQKYAKRHKLKLLEFESIKFQTDLLLEQSAADQAKELSEMLHDTTKIKTQMLEMAISYEKGDGNALLKFADDENMTEATESRLLTERNQKWMIKIPKMIADNSTFIAVGALHLYGSKGILQLLRDKGYTVIAIPINKVK